MRFIKILLVSLLIFNFAKAEKIERLGFYNLQEILEDDNLTEDYINFINENGKENKNLFNKILFVLLHYKIFLANIYSLYFLKQYFQKSLSF